MALNGATAPFGRKKVAPNPSQSETYAKGALVGYHPLPYPDPNPAHPGTERLRRNRHTSLRSTPSFAPAPTITAWTCVDSAYCWIMESGLFPPTACGSWGPTAGLFPATWRIAENCARLLPAR